MMKTFLLFLFTLLGLSTAGQSWQWRRNGGNGMLDSNPNSHIGYFLSKLAAALP